MLYNLRHVAVYDMCFLCSMTCVMLCYMTCVMLCYITSVMCYVI